jgi:hypothetical protein
MWYEEMQDAAERYADEAVKIRATPTPDLEIRAEVGFLYVKEQARCAFHSQRQGMTVEVEVGIYADDLARAIEKKFRDKGWSAQYCYNDEFNSYNWFEVSPPYNWFERLW